jgi:hypothetical protein
MYNVSVLKWKAVVVMVAFLSVTVTGQPNFGVLDFSSNFNNEYWNQDVAYEMKDLLVSGLAPIGTIQPLVREHILLLLKDMDPPDLDLLDEKVIMEIGKRQGLQYLVKGNLLALDVKDNIVTFKLKLAIYKTNDATIVWEKTLEVTHTLTDQELKEHILLSGGIFKPTLTDMINQIVKIKWK